MSDQPSAFRLRPRRFARLLVVLAWAAGVGGAIVLPGAAEAGEYRVFMCGTPAAGNVGTDGVTQDAVGTGLWYDNSCSSPGGHLGNALGLGTRATAEASFSRLAAPAGTLVKAFTLQRQVWMTDPPSGSTESATPRYSLYWQQRDDDHVIEQCNWWLSCRSMDGPASWASPGSGTPYVYWDVVCAGGPSTGCSPPAGAGPRATVWVSAIDATINDTSPPTVTAIGGAAVGAGKLLAGSTSATASASDLGAGVRQVIAKLDGKAAGVWNSTTPSCRDQGNTPSTAYDYTQLVPCSASADATVPVDTTVVGNGTHTLSFTAIDGSGSTSAEKTTQVEVRNTAASGGATGGPIGAVTGGTGPQGDVIVAKSRLASVPRGRKVVTGGKVVGADGAPLANARVVAWLRPHVDGAAWAELATLQTDGQGAFAVEVPTGGSRDVRFEYAYAGGAASKVVEVPVRAKLTLTAASRHVRRYGRLELGGVLGIDGLTKRGAYVDVQLRQGKKWRTVATQRTDASGKWSWKYRLPSGRSATYVFRARLRAYSNVASAPSQSKALSIRVG